jgi:chromatin remodeling complex protein RSC6
MLVWKLRIQGRLVHPVLPDFYRSQDQVEQRYTKKFNWFFRRIQAKLENGEIVEWRKEIYKKESDGIEITRKKESAGEVQISFFLDSCKFKLSPALSAFMGVAEETKEHVITTVWEYVKKEGLQDCEDQRYVNNDATLFRLFAETRTEVARLLSKLAVHMREPDPIVITHRVRLEGDWSETEHIYDFRVEIEDPFQFEVATYLGENRSVLFARQNFADKIGALRAQPGFEVFANPIDNKIREIDKKIKAILPAVSKHSRRRDSANQFLRAPTTFIKDLAGEQNDLASVLKSPGLEERMSEDREGTAYYRQPWVKDLAKRIVDLQCEQ